MPTTDDDSPVSRSAPRRAALALLCALATACVAPPPTDHRHVPAPPPPPPAQPACEPALEAADRAARHVVAQQDRLAAMSAAELQLEAAKAVDPATAGPQALVDAALALGLTRTPGDLAKGQALLDAVVRSTSPQADAWRGLARLLAARYAEQRRAEEAAERNAQALKDAQRDNQRRLDQLNDKLEALKAIERSLATRPGAAASRPGP